MAVLTRQLGCRARRLGSDKTPLGTLKRSFSSITVPCGIPSIGAASHPFSSSKDASGIFRRSSSSSIQSTQTRTLFGQSFEVRQIKAIRRTENDTGTNASKKARSAGLLPGRLYGIDADGRKHHINLWVRYEDLKAEYNTRRECFENTLYDLEIDGVTYRVLPRDLKKHPVRRQALSCDWLIYVPGRNPGYRVTLPTEAMNQERCIAFKQGGWLLDIMHKVPVYVFGDHIPDKVMLDLRGKKIGQSIQMSEVHLPDGVTPRHTDSDFAIAKLVGSKRLSKK